MKSSRDVDMKYIDMHFELYSNVGLNAENGSKCMLFYLVFYFSFFYSDRILNPMENFLCPRL